MSKSLPSPRKPGEQPRIAVVQGRRPLPPPPSAAPDGPSMAVLLRQLAVFLVLGGGLAYGIWAYVKGVREEGKQVRDATDSLRATADALWAEESFATQLPAVDEAAEAQLPRLMLTISGLKAKLKPDDRIEIFVAPIIRGMREVTWRDRSNTVLLTVHFKVHDDGGFKFLTFTTDPNVKPAEVPAPGTIPPQTKVTAAPPAVDAAAVDSEVKGLIEQLKKETSVRPAPVPPPVLPPVPSGPRSAGQTPAAPNVAPPDASPGTLPIPPRIPAPAPGSTAAPPAKPSAEPSDTPTPEPGTGLKNP